MRALMSMERCVRARRTISLLLTGGVLALCCTVPAVGYAQDDATDPATKSGTTSAAEAIDADAIVAPREVVEDTQEDPAEAPPPPPTAQPDVGSGETQPTATQPRIALGNAAFQPSRARKAEARRACAVDTPPPTSPMLGMVGTVVVDDRRNWGLLLLAPAAGIGLFALYLTLLRRGAPGAARPGDPLERVATLVAITAGLAGLVLQFAPGVAVAERPVREATMKVREVHPRVTRGDYAKATGARTSNISKIDKREVGNVIWLELNLRGYEGARPVLQYGLYDEARGEVLLSNTTKNARLGRQRGDEQKSFVPVWVGYPTTSRFRARFRLLDRGRVQEMARTGKMRGSAYRYACS